MPMLAPTTSRRLITDERPVALMGAELAMVGMIDRDQRIDAGVPRRLELLQLELALVVRQGPQRIAHQPDGRQPEVHHLDAGHGGEQPERRLDHAGNAGMAVQGDAHRHGDGATAAAVRRCGSPRNRMNGVISNGRLPVLRS